MNRGNSNSSNNGNLLVNNVCGVSSMAEKPPRKGRKVRHEGNKLILLNKDETYYDEVASPFQDARASLSVDRCIEKNIEWLVNSGEQVNNRRQMVMNFFWLVNAGVLAGVGSFTKSWIEKLPNSYLNIDNCLQSILLMGCNFGLGYFGFVACRYWERLIRNYAAVSGSKVDLMQALEEFRAVKMFTVQYEIVDKSDKYEYLSTIETELAKSFRWLHAVIWGLSGIGFTLSFITLLRLTAGG